MPDVTQVLTQDHRKVEQLFQQFMQDGQQGQGQGKLAQEICRQLEIHTMVEEELVYPRLARIDQPLEHEAEDEHQQAKKLIEQIRAGSGQQRQLMQQLQQAVQHHVQEEEGKAFPEMRERMGGELSSLGDQVERRKQQLMEQGR